MRKTGPGMMKVVAFLRILISAVLLCTVTACAGAPAQVVSSGDRYVANANTDTIEDYKLGAGDKIRVTVFNEPTLSGEFAVGSSGNLSLPLIGDVQGTGRTPQEVALAVQTKLADGYLRDPKVSVEVINFRPFFILGEVKAPGQYPYSAGLTVPNAVATAQGFTPRAARGIVYIRRAGTTEEVAFQVSPDLRVLPGDTIRIGERYF